jgi:hypothetical protein
MMVNIKSYKVELVFDVWDNELTKEDVCGVISGAIDKAGYSCASGPVIISVTEREEVV